jgi:hypothetical protein
MSSTTISNKQEHREGEIVIDAVTGKRKKRAKGRWRYLCSFVNCDRETQKGNLCYAHRPRSRFQQQIIKPAVIFNQSSANLIIDENTVTAPHGTNATFHILNITEQNTCHIDGEE